MGDNHHSSSEEDDFCRISSDGGHSDHDDDVPGQDGTADPEQKDEAASSPQVSEYCQVVFQNVAESYKPGTPLECYYTISPVLVPSQRDYISVYKVGWNSIRNYVTFEYAPYPKNWQPNQEYKQCILFNTYYLPKEEDGEFYQFCYIDSSGKMRGASTPFQFLQTPMDDYMEITDESLDILMIESKKSHNSELVVHLTAERDDLTAEKAQIEKEKNQLVGKVEELEAAVGVKEEEVNEAMKNVQTLEATLETLQIKITDADKELDEREAEIKRYEETLQQTTDTFLEVQGNMTKVEEDKDSLKKELDEIFKERDEFKGHFASTEKDNETLRTEIDYLKDQLMEANEQNQVILTKEVVLKEEKLKVEQQLLVASSDKDHTQSLKAQVVGLENSVQKCEEDRKKLNEQLKALSDFHAKLTQDYEKAVFDGDHLKTKLIRQGDDFLKKQKKLEQHMSLMQHQANEKRTLLEDQVSALKEGIQKLAKDKESLLQGQVGSEEASHVAVQSFKDKMTKSQRKAEDESHKRLQVQKELLSLKEAMKMEKEDHGTQVTFYRDQVKEAKENVKQIAIDAEKEIGTLKVRLEMAKEEYKVLYKEVRKTDDKKGANKKQNRKGSLDDQQIESPIRKEAETVQTASSQSFDDEEMTYDSRDMTLTMDELNRQLIQLTKELQKREESTTRYQTLYEEERMKRKQTENLYQEMQETKRLNEDEMRKKYQEKHADLSSWKERFNKLHDEYMRIKHENESLRYDIDLTQSHVKKSTKPSRQSPSPPLPFPRPSERKQASHVVARSPPASSYSNVSADESFKVKSPPGTFGSGCFKIPPPPSAIPKSSFTPKGSPRGSTDPNLYYNQSSDVRGASRNNLPEPLQPQKTQQAKHMEIRASIQDKHDGTKRPSAPPIENEEAEDIYSAEKRHGEGSFPREVEADSVRMEAARPHSPTEFHDAQEYRADCKQCPQCHMSFALSVTDEELAEHMQSHYAYQCPLCHALLNKDVNTEEDFRRHVDSHSSIESHPLYCPVCKKICIEMTSEKLQQHVQSHFTN